MADKYWYAPNNGTGSADWSVAANWYTAPNGGGVAAGTVPGTADAAILTGGGTITIAAAASCNGLFCSTFTGTLAGPSTLNINDTSSLVEDLIQLSEGMTFTWSGPLTINGSGSATYIRTANKTFNGNVTLSKSNAAANATYSPIGNFTVLGTLTHTSSDLIDTPVGTGTGTISFGAYIQTGTGLRDLNFPTPVNITGSGTVITFLNFTGTAPTFTLTDASNNPKTVSSTASVTNALEPNLNITGNGTGSYYINGSGTTQGWNTVNIQNSGGATVSFGAGTIGNLYFNTSNVNWSNSAITLTFSNGGQYIELSPNMQITASPILSLTQSGNQYVLTSNGNILTGQIIVSNTAILYCEDTARLTSQLNINSGSLNATDIWVPSITATGASIHSIDISGILHFTGAGTAATSLINLTSSANLTININAISLDDVIPGSGLTPTPGNKTLTFYPPKTIGGVPNTPFFGANTVYIAGTSTGTITFAASAYWIPDVYVTNKNATVSFLTATYIGLEFSNTSTCTWTNAASQTLSIQDSIKLSPIMTETCAIPSIIMLSNSGTNPGTFTTGGRKLIGGAVSWAGNSVDSNIYGVFNSTGAVTISNVTGITCDSDFTCGVLTITAGDLTTTVGGAPSSLTTSSNVTVASITSTGATLRRLTINGSGSLYFTGSGTLANIIDAGFTQTIPRIYINDTTSTSAKTLTLSTIFGSTEIYLAGTTAGLITLNPGTTYVPNVYVTNTGGSVSIGTSGTIASLTFQPDTTAIWANTAVALSITGNLTLTDGQGAIQSSPSITFTGSGGSTLTMPVISQKILTGLVTFTGASSASTIIGPFTSTGGLTINSGQEVNCAGEIICGTLTLTSGSLVAGDNVSISSITSNSGTTRALTISAGKALYFTGSGTLATTTTTGLFTATIPAIYINDTTNTGLAKTLALNDVLTSANVYLAGNTTGLITLSPGTNMSMDVYVTNTGGSVSFSNGTIKSLTFHSSTTASWENAGGQNLNIVGNLTLAASQGTIVQCPSMTFIGSAGSTLTMNGRNLVFGTVTFGPANFPSTITGGTFSQLTGGTGITINSGQTLTSALDITCGVLTLTSGTLSVPNLFAFSITSNSGTTRRLEIAAGKALYLTGTGTLATTTTTNFTASIPAIYVYDYVNSGDKSLALNAVLTSTSVYLAGNQIGLITLDTSAPSSTNTDVYVTNTGGSVSFSNGTINSLTFVSGTTAVWANAGAQTLNIAGNLTLAASQLPITLCPSMTFTGTAGSTLTMAGKTLVGGTVTFSGTGSPSTITGSTFSTTQNATGLTINRNGTVNINNAITCGALTLTSGTLSAGSNVSVSSITLSGTATRELTIAAGSALYFWSNGTLSTLTDTTGLTSTIPEIHITESTSATKTLTLDSRFTSPLVYMAGTGTGLITLAPLSNASTDVYVSNTNAGGSVSFSNGTIKSLTFQSTSAAGWANSASQTLNIVNNLTLSAIMTQPTLTPSMTFTGSGGSTLTMNGKLLKGGTVTFATASSGSTINGNFTATATVASLNTTSLTIASGQSLTISGATELRCGALTLTSGTLSIANLYVNSITLSGSATRTLSTLGGALHFTGSGTLSTLTNTTNLSATIPRINIIDTLNAGAKTLTLDAQFTSPLVYMAGNTTGLITLDPLVGATNTDVYVTNTGGSVSFSNGTIKSLTFQSPTNALWQNLAGQAITITNDLTLISTQGTVSVTPAITLTGQGLSGNTVTMGTKSLVGGTLTVSNPALSLTFADAFSTNAAVTFTNALVNCNASFTTTAAALTIGGTSTAYFKNSLNAGATTISGTAAVNVGYVSPSATNASSSSITTLNITSTAANTLKVWAGTFACTAAITNSGGGEIVISGISGTLTTLNCTSITLSNGSDLIGTHAQIIASGAFSTTNGTINLNNSTASFSTFGFSGATSNFTANNSTISIIGTGATAFSMAAAAGLQSFTLTNTPIQFTNTANTALTFAGGGNTYGDVTFNRGASTAAITITGSNTFTYFRDLGTVAHILQFTGGTTNTFTDTFDVSGESGAVITINRTTTVATFLKKAAGIVSIQYVTVNSVNALGPDGNTAVGIWFAANSTIAGTSAGWNTGTLVKTLGALGVG